MTVRSGGICCGPEKIPTKHRCRGCQKIVPIGSIGWIMQWPLCEDCCHAWDEYMKVYVPVQEIYKDSEILPHLFAFLKTRLPKTKDIRGYPDR